MSLSYLTIAPLGKRLDGRPIWPFTGAAPDGDGDGGAGDGGGDGDGDDGDGGNEPDPDSLEGLKKALERERETNKQKSREVRGFKTLMRDSGAKSFDEFKTKVTGAGSGSKNGATQQDAVDVEAIKAAAKAEALAEANASAAKSITEAKIEAMATKGFMTPRDAVLALRDDIEDLITDEGKPDVKAIERALGGLLKDRPHWKREGGGATDYDGGARNTAPAATGFSAQLRNESAKKRGRG
jgi:hypothetical protein